jgi:hypothetical protein
MARRYLILTAAVCLAAPAFCDEAATARRFEAAKRSEPELIAFLKSMPKGADLHNHVAGAVYAESLLDFAARSDFFIDPATLSISTQAAAGLVPTKDLLTDKRLAAGFLDALSMRGERPSESGHDHFFNTFHLFSSLMDAMGPDARLAEVIGRAKSQNVQYLELMDDVASDPAEEQVLKDPPATDDLEKALSVMQKRFPPLLADAKAYLDDRDREVAKLLGLPAPISSVQSPITVRYLFTAYRLWPDDRFFAYMAAGMALAQGDPRIAGLNIAAPEDDPRSRRNFESQMRIIDFLWSRLGKPNMTLHAGELTLQYSPLEPMRCRIRKSIELGHSRRIGHGVSIAWEDDLPGLFQEMRDQRVAVEINLTSNESILKVAGDRHPFSLYRANRIPLTLNTDDEGVNRSNLTMEYVKAARTFGLSYKDLKGLSRNGLEYSFLPGESLFVAGDYRRPRPEFSRVFEPHWQPDARARALMAKSEKLALQVRLERAFVGFEK